MRYNNYHKHDHVSNIFTPDSCAKAEDYIKKCVEYGHINYFTTNHGSFGDIFEARTLCNQYGLRCIAGIEGYIVPDPTQKDKSNYHIIVIPKTDAARKKMNYVSSMANINGYYYKPRFFLTDLLALDPNDVYITTACVAGIIRDKVSYEQIFLPLYEHFGNNVMLEIQSHIDGSQIEVNKRAKKLNKKYGLKLIAANDSHYINEEDIKDRSEFLKGKHIEYGIEDSFILDFPTAETMIQRFDKQGVFSREEIHEAINNTLIFDECEEIQLDYSIKMPTIYPELTPSERVDLLKKEVSKRFNKIKEEEHITGEDYQIYKEGIKYEMKIIEDTNEEIHTADYFLFNEKNVDIAVNKYGGVLTRGGRGSCGSFYINRILGMTQLDRFKIKLPIFPDRFASTSRLLQNRALPDIDYNVMAQEPFVRASKDLLGEHGCYPMYAPGTMQLSEAFRNVCRSKNLDYDKFNEVAKDIEKYAEDPEWKPIIEEAQKFVGIIVSGSVHPCAHLLSSENILYEYGVTRLGENVCVLITSSEADEYKVLKNDYLIVKVWKLIAETFDLIGIPILPANQLLEKIKDDDKVWNLFAEGLTCTLNQVDSDNGMMQAKRYGIKSFEDGAFVAAAIRPSFDAWREKFLSHSNYSTGSDQLDEVLSMTNHFILYQENLMQYFEWLGVTPAESIGLIKKISKKKIKPEDFKNLEERIRKAWIENTGSEDMFDETWGMIQGCMSYGFCSAHAAATSLDMCYGAYLKANYPLEYFTVCFNNYEGDEERTRKLKNELKYFGIKITDIQFRYSQAQYTCDKKQWSIYKGLASIKYMSEAVSKELYELRNNKYPRFTLLLRDINEKTSCDSRQLDILTKLNFFSEFGDINLLLKTVEIFNKLGTAKILKKDKVTDIPEYILSKYCKETEKQWRVQESAGLLDEVVFNIRDKIPKTKISDRIKWELEFLGYINIVLPKADDRYHYVQKLYDNRASLYCIKTGETILLKFRKKAYDSNPFYEKQIIKIKEIRQEKKWKLLKDEHGNELLDDKGNKQWTRLDEYEDILGEWVVLQK